MPRYFLEVAYLGTGFSGFQVQPHARTIQSEVERALRVLYRRPVELTGSSRTDAGVHALQNYFHFDWEPAFDQRSVYNLNALLPPSVVVKSVREVHPGAHCRFHALSRSYRYTVYQYKDPFLNDRGWYFPYQLDREVLLELAALVPGHTSFHSFSKRNTQVRTYECRIYASGWAFGSSVLEYRVSGNRFLRGMVRGLVGSMLRVARGNGTVEGFRGLLQQTELAGADFSAPACGLVLEAVEFDPGVFLS
ncbi:MAG TPA: tRNA pseudouridine(38-40) synthase TruA [Lacibacter sp.]|nr:tRNA pseudouridine(38-40) synthase TruA [Lacibacter sp.]HMO89476.1 tRNA pseudouridine(38-40) synthase TruA [Lacibacter sp.]